MLEKSDQTDQQNAQRRRAVRTAVILGALVVGYYVIFILSHVR